MTDENIPSTDAALVHDLTEIVAGANAADWQMVEAREAHQRSGDTSIRALADRVAAINYDLTPKRCREIADRVAENIAKGNANIKKSRKSELVKCLEQRHHIKRVVREADEAIADRSRRIDLGEDIRPGNLRSTVLQSLTILRKDATATVAYAVSEVIDKLDADGPSKHERLAKQLVKLYEDPELATLTGPDGKKHLPQPISDAVAAVITVLGGTPPEAASGPTAGAQKPAAPVDELQEAGISLAPDDEPVETEPDNRNSEVAAAIEKLSDDMVPVVEPDEDDEFDFESFTKGLL